MGAQPKQRIVKGRRNRRRSHHALRPMNFGRCTQCRSLVSSHRVCPVCGYYRNTEVVATEQPKVKYR
ncbi:MAG: 50S ribosomal protein L32 [Chloroflexi bacterium]|nr:50S ribosomal protein L32 [Chloroflexota bacterium]MCY3938263.1 50S ribosomal protein L32 [Chloroflexota bacterium]MCY4107970.1 50S ribosomal protein L32 [Chloroflexota bacterium]